ncbi:MAG: SEC-C metal-binding domain-containing protein [Planctomycetota bacterium]
MAVNPYSPCPCGSGKKFKFCCQDVLADLQRIVSLSSNQPEIALNQLQQLAVKHPDRESVARELVVMLLRFNRVQDAMNVCTDFLKTHPDNPQILIVFADICLQVSGFDSSRRILHRAFQVCTRQFPQEVANIVVRVGLQLYRRNLAPAAREHALLAMRLSKAEHAEAAATLFQTIEADPQVPYLLNSSWPLLNFDASPEMLQQHERALRLCRLGCWEPAAIIYNRLADQAPTNSAVWYNMGLCQMWDGRHPEAAASLHHAAVLSGDFEEAAEIEALAQSLDPRLFEEQFTVLSLNLEVRSVTEVVSRLLAHPRIKNTQSHDHAHCNHDEGCRHAAELMLISQPSPGPEDVTADHFAQFIADVDVYDLTDPDAAADSGHAHPWIEITCSSTSIDDVVVAIRDCVGDLILTSAEEEKRTHTRAYPRFAQPFEVRPVRPDGITENAFRQLSRQIEERAVEQALHAPQALLGGKSLLDAATDPALHRQVAGAVYVLHSHSGNEDIAINIDGIRSRLNLPPRAPLNAAAAENARALSILALARLPLTELTDQQLRIVVGRSSTPGGRDLLSRTLDEMIKRGESCVGAQAVAVYMSRATIAHGDGDFSLCFELVDKARQSVTGPEAFRMRLELDIRELAWRLKNPDDSAIITLLHKIRDLYLRKIPELADLIREQLVDADCSHLLPEFQLEKATPQSSALWTPGSPNPSASAAPSALWLPGQS